MLGGDTWGAAAAGQCMQLATCKAAVLWTRKRQSAERCFPCGYECFSVRCVAKRKVEADV